MQSCCTYEWATVTDPIDNVVGHGHGLWEELAEVKYPGGATRQERLKPARKNLAVMSVAFLAAMDKCTSIFNALLPCM
jgi:hypothetical protein